MRRKNIVLQRLSSIRQSKMTMTLGGLSKTSQREKSTLMGDTNPVFCNNTGGRIII